MTLYLHIIYTKKAKPMEISTFKPFSVEGGGMRQYETSCEVLLVIAIR